MLRFSRTPLEILQYLYERIEKHESKPYLTEMAKELGTTKAVMSDNVRNLERSNLVESEKKGPLKFYKLSAKGEALAWALLNPDALADLYKMEETERGREVKVPLTGEADLSSADRLWALEEKVIHSGGKYEDIVQLIEQARSLKERKKSDKSSL